MLIFDCEIIRAIPKRGEKHHPDIDYVTAADPWRAFGQLGVSVVGAYDYREDRYRVFLEDNLPEFVALAWQHDFVVGFNSLRFDAPLLAASVGEVPTAPDRHYDLLREVWMAAGLNPHSFNPRTHGGFGLEPMSVANGGDPKSGHGAMAPVWWQRGQRGRVIDYCLDDVRLTKELMDQVLATGVLRNPKGGADLRMAAPNVPPVSGP